jgi:hypothetical protein
VWPHGGHSKMGMSSCPYGHVSLLMQGARESSSRSFVQRDGRHAHKSCIVNRALGPIKRHDIPPSKKNGSIHFWTPPYMIPIQPTWAARVHSDTSHPPLVFLALLWSWVFSSLSNHMVSQALLGQFIHTATSSSYKLYTLKSYWSNKKMDVGYYAPVARTILNLGVLLCAFRYHTSLTPLSISQSEAFNFPASNL